MKPRSLATIAALLFFIAFLTWSTLSAQKVKCNVCVRFNGKRNCAVASQATVEEAQRAAQSTACGPVTSGMNEAIACDRLEPETEQCSAK